MTDIQVMGLPKTVKKQRFVHLLRNVIFGKKLRCKFWINEIYSLPNSNYLQVLLNIARQSDAYVALELINNFSYFNGKEHFQLSAVIVDKSLSNDYDDSMADEIFEEQFKRDWAARGSKEAFWGSSENVRSRSPHYEKESIKIEMEIDLVRKQRLLVEEERKLLLEKKKLQFLKEFGPSSVQQLEEYAAAIDKHTLDDDDPPQLQNVASKSSVAPTGLPLFVLPCRRITREMKGILPKISDATEKEKLMKPLRLKIRKRIGELLKGLSFKHAGEIYKLYRDKYSIETDGKLLEQLLSELDFSLKVDEEKASDIKEIVNVVQEEKEVKLLTDQSNSDIKIIKTETLSSMVNNDKVCVKEEVDGTDGVNAVNAGQVDEMKTDEPTTVSEIEHITDDINDDLDDWLDDDMNEDDSVLIQEDPPEDVIEVKDIVEVD